jgi:hypothetical protein
MKKKKQKRNPHEQETEKQLKTEVQMKKWT